METLASGNPARNYSFWVPSSPSSWGENKGSLSRGTHFEKGKAQACLRTCHSFSPAVWPSRAHGATALCHPSAPAIPLSKEPVAPSCGSSLPVSPAGFGLHSCTDLPAPFPRPPVTQDAHVGVPWGPLADRLPHTCPLPSTHTHLFILEHVRERRALKMTFTLHANKATMPHSERQEPRLHLGLQFHFTSTHPQTHSTPWEERRRPGKAKGILSICPPSPCGEWEVWECTMRDCVRQGWCTPVPCLYQQLLVTRSELEAPVFTPPNTGLACWVLWCG